LKTKDDQYLESVLRLYEPGEVGLTFEYDEARDDLLLVNDVLTIQMTFDWRDRYYDAKVFSKDRYRLLSETKNPFECIQIYDQTYYIRNLCEESNAILAELEFDRSPKCTSLIHDAFHAFEKVALEIGENVPHSSNITEIKIYTKNPKPSSPGVCDTTE
jgi:hypothetical protein